MNLVEVLVSNIDKIYPLLWFGFPLFVLGRSASILLKFNSKHRQNKILVTDQYDDQNFNKVIKPLYSSVNRLLLEKMISNNNFPSDLTAESLREYESNKATLLSAQDISQFEESLEFAQMQDEIINAKRSKYKYKLHYKRAIRMLGIILLLSAIHLVVAILFWFFGKIPETSLISTAFLGIWASIAIAQVVLIVIYFMSDNALDKYEDKDAN